MAQDERKIKIIIVNDHTLIRTGLRTTLLPAPNIEITGKANCGTALFHLLPTTETDLIFLYINLPDMKGVDIVSRLHNNYPNVKTFAISAKNDSKTVKTIANAGINGFISKQKSVLHVESEAGKGSRFWFEI